MEFLGFCALFLAVLGVAAYIGWRAMIQKIAWLDDLDREPWEPGYRGKG